MNILINCYKIFKRGNFAILSIFVLEVENEDVYWKKDISTVTIIIGRSGEILL